MSDSVFALASFGLLLYLGKPVLRRSARLSMSFVGASLKEGVLIFAHTLFLLSMNYFVTNFLLIDNRPDAWTALSLLPAAYILVWAFERSPFIFLTVYGLSAFLIERAAPPALSAYLLSALVLSLGLAVFQILMLGLQWRLRFSGIPKPLTGLPIFLVTAALLLLAVGRFLPIFF